jgi:hypothetical protein
MGIKRLTLAACIILVHSAALRDIPGWRNAAAIEAGAPT